MDRIDFMRAATEQLDAAITLAENGSFIPAITLAAAAEEVAGKRLGPDASLRELVSALSLDLDAAAALNEATGAKNLLKHWDSASNPDEVSIFLEFEAMSLIVRAIFNLHTLRCRDGRDMDDDPPEDEVIRTRRGTVLQNAFLKRNRYWLEAKDSDIAKAIHDPERPLAVGHGSTTINRRDK